MISAKQQYNQTNWQAYVPDKALGTFLLAVGIILGYCLVITSALKGDISYLWASAICTYLAFASFTVVHDAGHGSVISAGSSLKHFESILGWAFSLPLLIIPFRFFQKIHDRHHAFTNDPDRDPDHYKFAHSKLMLILNCLYIPVQYHILAFTKLKHIKTFQDTYLSSAIYFVITMGVGIALTYLGYGSEVFYFAVLPTIIGTILLTLLFDYLPHHPHKSRDRYHDTRIYPGKLLNVLLLGQNYHLIHHMYPRVPWYKYEELYQRVLPDLEANNAPIEDVFWGIRPGFLKSPNTQSLLKGGNEINMVLEVSGIETLTNDAIEVKFKLPKGEKLNYKAGQYITVSKWLGGEQQTRCYSLCSAPHKGELNIGVRKTNNGFVSTFINQSLKPSDELIVQGPFGDFVYPPEEKGTTEHLFLIAGGSGITPILSIAESALTLDKTLTIQLIYACRDVENIMFNDKLKQLQAFSQNRLSIHYAISQQEANQHNISGKLDESIIRNLQPALFENTGKGINTQVYICGPEGMRNMLFDTFKQANVPITNIHVEKFAESFSQPKGELHEVSIKLNNGETHSLAVASNQTVLEVAKAKGVKLPHACSLGTCGSCKVRINKGKYKAIEDSVPGITVAEKLEGLTLSCQCQPLEDLSIVEE